MCFEHSLRGKGLCWKPGGRWCDVFDLCTLGMLCFKCTCLWTATSCCILLCFAMHCVMARKMSLRFVFHSMAFDFVRPQVHGTMKKTTALYPLPMLTSHIRMSTWAARSVLWWHHWRIDVISLFRRCDMLPRTSVGFSVSPRRSGWSCMYFE